MESRPDAGGEVAQENADDHGEENPEGEEAVEPAERHKGGRALFRPGWRDVLAFCLLRVGGRRFGRLFHLAGMCNDILSFLDIYIYMCVCVCVCVCIPRMNKR